MKHRDRLLAIFAATALFAPWVVHADEKKADADRSPVDCIIVRNIDRTDIIDDRTIVFYMRGSRKDIYVNHLPSNCPNLEAEDRFGYNVTGGRLCKVDMIQALPRIGIPIPCRMGKFTPSSLEEVEELHAIHDQGRKGEKFDVKPVDPPKETPAASDAAPNGADSSR